MFKLFMIAFAALSFPAVAQEYQATTTTNAIVRQAPGPTYQKIGVIPAGTAVSVEICFDRGAFCKIAWDGPQAGFVSGDLMTIGATGQTVLQAEEAKWQEIDSPKQRVASPTPASANGDLEACPPWVDPDAEAKAAAAKAAAAATADQPPQPPLKFGDVSAQGNGPELVFLGDSLTDQVLADATSKLMGGRAYRVFQIGGQNSALLSGLFLKEDVPPDAIGIIWIGRNSDPGDPASIIADIDKAGRHVPSGKYLVVDYLSGNFVGEQPGEARRQVIDRLNAEIAARFGQRTLHVRPLITCADYKDSIHLTTAGREKVAKAIASILSAQGW